MYMPPDLSRYRPSPAQFQQILNGSILPIQATDPNCLFRLNENEFQFDHLDGVFKPDIAIRISRSPLLPNDPSTYASLSKFVEQNLRKYHTTLGNVNQNQLSKPLSLPPDSVGVQPGGKTEVLPIGCSINPLIADHFKEVHLTPGSIVKIIDFNKTVDLNNVKKLDGLKLPKSNLNRSSSSFIVKVISSDNFTKKLNNSNKFMVGCHGRIINLIALQDDPREMEVDVPLLRITITSSVITAVSIFAYLSSNGEREMDILMGFASGDLLWINPFKMKYSRWNKNSKIKNKPIMSLQWSKCGEFAIVGFSDGEMMIFNRNLDDNENYSSDLINNKKYIKKTKYMKVFKSLLSKSNPTSNPIAHYRFLRDSITDVQIHPIFHNLLILSCDDGYIRIFDLLKEKISDLFPSYYSGFLCVNITRDGKYLLAGSGDDFVSIYEFQYNDVSTNGLLKLVARLQGSKSWIRAIQIDYKKSNSGLLYRIGVVGDDNYIRFYEFQPRNLPKIKHLKSGKPIKTLTKPQLEKRLSSTTVDSITNIKHFVNKDGTITPSGCSSNRKLFTPKHLRNADSISSLTSSNQQHHTLSLFQVINQGSNTSLTQVHHQSMSLTPNINNSSVNTNNNINTNGLNNATVLSNTNGITNPLFKESLATNLINLDGLTETLVHPCVGLKYCPVLLPIGEKNIRLGRLSGLWFEDKYVWAFVSTGDCVRWTRP